MSTATIAPEFALPPLLEYLRAHLSDIDPKSTLRRFEGGQSNPTYLLTGEHRSVVLRKKPPGPLLPSAHAIEREFRVLQALQGTDVPVPEALHLCADEDVIGQAFYVMEYLPGRIVHDVRLPDFTPEARRALFADMSRVLAALHDVDPATVGLGDFGRPDGFVKRQVELWTRQYLKAKVEKVEAMDLVADWLMQHLPAQQHASIVHGDFRLGNVVVHPDEPRIIGVLDWELSSLGHPLCDVGYNCLPWYQDPETGGLAGMTVDGVPRLEQHLQAYFAQRGLQAPADLHYFVVFSLYRTAAILAGVYRRAVDGQGSSLNSREVGGRYRLRAEQAWQIASTARFT